MQPAHHTNSYLPKDYSAIGECAKDLFAFGFSFAQDAILLPFAGAVTVAVALGYDYNPAPENIIKHKKAIVLVHGAGFNESEWTLPRFYLDFLQSETYGSVFSLNLDGLISNDPTKGIQDYAEKVRKFINEHVVFHTECKEVVLIGHSLGGLTALQYALRLAKQDDVIAKHLFPFSSPLRGTPTIDLVWKVANVRQTKIHNQMSFRDGKEEERKFREELVDEAVRAQLKGEINIYNAWSTTDWAVPTDHGQLPDHPDSANCQYETSFQGHYFPVYSPSLWRWTCKHLDAIYKT